MSLPNSPIQVVTSNIVESDAEVLVNSANNFLRHGSGVARAISDAISGHQRRCDRYIAKKGSLPIGAAIMFPAGKSGNHPEKHVIHAAGMGYKKMNRKGTCSEKVSATMSSVHQAVFHALSLASKSESQTVALPLMCSRKGGLTKEESALAMIGAISTFEEVSGVVFQNIFFHTFEAEDKEALENVLKTS